MAALTEKVSNIDGKLQNLQPQVTDREEKEPREEEDWDTDNTDRRMVALLGIEDTPRIEQAFEPRNKDLREHMLQNLIK